MRRWKGFQAPTMPWDEPGRMPWLLADAFRRMTAARGSAALLFFANESMELFTRLEYGENGEMTEMHEDDRRRVILDYYAELEELHGYDHAQRFCRLWVTLADYLEVVRKGAIARAALRKQHRRVALR